MKIVCISDTHGSHHRVKVPPGDVLIHSGDCTATDNPSQWPDFLRWLDHQPHAVKILVCGNHDQMSERAPGAFRALLAEHAPTVRYLCDSGTEVNGFYIWGSPVQPEFLHWAWNRNRGSAIKWHWDKIPAFTNILVTHGPAHGMHDHVPGHDINNPADGNVGCLDLANTIKNHLHDLRLHVCGHIHLHGGKQAERDGVIYVNAAVLDEGYKLRHEPVVVEAEV